MKLNSIGANIKHEDTFLIDRPHGLGDNLLLIFKSDARVFIEGEWISVNSGSFIVYRKGSEQKYGALGKEYINHYMHFDVEDERFFSSINLLTDRIAYLQNVDEIENLFKLLGREQISNSDYRLENTNLFIQILLRKLAENQCEKQKEVSEVKHLEELTNLRSEMYSTPARYKSIRELADHVNLSISHFQALYSNFFGVSCYEDLLQARINGAKGFLENSNLQIKEIATLCGYDSDSCFMRIFKIREGMTPSEYRRNSHRGSALG